MSAPRTVLRSVEITGDRVTIVMPQPNFAPFFNLAEAGAGRAENDEGQPDEAAPCQGSTLAGGSDGSRFRACILPPGAMVFAAAPLRRKTGASGRDPCRDPRVRKLPPERAAELRNAAPGRSLRSLAAEFGVSHETVRAVLRARGVRPADAAA